MALFGTNGETRSVRREREKLAVAEMQLRRRIAESSILQLDAWVDPREAFLDERGIPWQVIAIGASGVSAETEDQIIAPSDDGDLRTMRVRSRMLVQLNEFAGCALDNLVDYTVGSGMTYRVQAREGQTISQDVIDAVQEKVDLFLEVNDFGNVERESVRRRHRDGEYFLRRFPMGDGITRLRYVEPADVRRPQGETSDPNTTFGVRTDPGDVRTVLQYFLATENRWVPADEIVHAKQNVDANSKRGIPTFYHLRGHLDAAVDTLDFMHKLIRLQGSIGLIRKHTEATGAQVTQFRADKADVQATDGVAGKDLYFKKLTGPKTIDIPKGMDYSFPPSVIDASTWVEVVQAVLRAPASRLRMPEWMFTGRLDAKYANAFASESPFVRMIVSQQHDHILKFSEVVEKAVALMIEADPEAAERVRAIADTDQGRTTDGAEPEGVDVWSALELQVEPPAIEVRDKLKDAQTNKILQESRVMSRRTWAARSDLDWEQELANIEDEETLLGQTVSDELSAGDQEPEEEEQAAEKANA